VKKARVKPRAAKSPARKVRAKAKAKIPRWPKVVSNQVKASKVKNPANKARARAKRPTPTHPTAKSLVKANNPAKGKAKASKQAKVAVRDSRKPLMPAIPINAAISASAPTTIATTTTRSPAAHQ
jgi:hypothetical protein